MLNNAKLIGWMLAVSHTDFKMIILQVTYHTDLFLDKNRDYVVVEHQALLMSSKSPFVSGLFLSLAEDGSKSSYKFSSVATRFKVLAFLLV